MPVRFNCSEHGRFTLQMSPTGKGLTLSQLLTNMPKVIEAECPVCHVLCKPCPDCRGYKPQKKLAEVTLQPDTRITAWMRENWRNTRTLHCPRCELGVVCQVCGKDYSRGIPIQT